jgi:predicted nuclease of predicted toxin-antitoxin system
MKVLLDECVPERLRGHLKGHEIHSVRYAGLSGSKNGELLRLAEEAGYDVLLTVDHGIPYQNSVTGRGIAVIVLRAPGYDIDTLKQMTNAVVSALITISTGEIITLDYSPTRD